MKDIASLKKDVLSSASHKTSFLKTFCEQRTDYNLKFRKCCNLLAWRK